MFALTKNCQRIGKMIPVNAPVDIEYLVKESEVITGQAGRTFVISGADRIFYRVQWHPIGYRVQRLDGGGTVICTQTMPADELHFHSLGEALRAGQLFTTPVKR